MAYQEDEIPLLDKVEAAGDEEQGRPSLPTAHTKRTPAAWAPIDSFQHSFNPSIEGLRGIAVTMTMYCHIPEQSFNPREVAGNMGVSIFLVLSGFLITAVLIRLKSQSSSSVRLLGRFYTDRFFRLTPALILVVGLVYPIHYQRHAGKDMASVNQYALLALSYLSNWPSLRPSSETGPWGNTWSLAVEEQFYIFWAVALPMLLPRGTRLRAFILFASTTSLFVVFRIYSSMYDGVLWGLDWRFGLLANVWKMLVGASLRLLPSPVWLLNRVWAYVGLLGFAITLGLSCLDQPNYGSIAPGWGDSTRPLLAFADLSSVILTSLLLCGVSGPKGGIAILELQPVRFVGRVSYSWYLWQVPLIELNYWRRGYPAIGDTAIAFIMAMISTLYVEEPINKVYKQWKRQNSSSKTIMSLA